MAISAKEKDVERSIKTKLQKYYSPTTLFIAFKQNYQTICYTLVHTFLLVWLCCNGVFTSKYIADNKTAFSSNSLNMRVIMNIHYNS